MKWNDILNDWLTSFLSVIFPNLCGVCGTTLVRGEKVICTTCMFNLPRMQEEEFELNSVEKKCFISGCCVRGTALFKYHRHDSYTSIIKDFKYHGRKDVAVTMGEILAKEKSSLGFFSDIDILIPIPMHFLKKARRGYNQAEEIAKGIKIETSIPIANNLIAKKGHTTQTFKSAEERWRNIENIFAVRNPEQLAGKHVALIDDVVTTGSTMQHCAMTLRNSIPDIKISFIALATTEN